MADVVKPPLWSPAGSISRTTPATPRTMPARDFAVGRCEPANSHSPSKTQTGMVAAITAARPEGTSFSAQKRQP